MSAIAIAFHVLPAVIWVGGMFVIYVCLTSSAWRALIAPQRLRLMRPTRPIAGCYGTIDLEIPGNPLPRTRRDREPILSPLLGLTLTQFNSSDLAGDVFGKSANSRRRTRW